MGEVGGRENDNELHEAEGDVEQGALHAIEAEARNDNGAESICHSCGDVEAHGHTNKQPTFGLVKSFPDLTPLELVSSRAGLIGAKTLDGLQLLVLGEKPGRGNVAVEEVPDDGGGEDGNETNKDEENLPRVDGSIDLAQAIRDRGSKHGGKTVGAVPACHAHGLFSATVPLRSDDGEKGQAAGLEQAQQEAGCQETCVVVACGHAHLRDTPTQDQGRHQDAVRHLDDEPRGKGLPCELGDGSDGADHGVFISGQVAVCSEAMDGTVSEDGLIEDLEEVDPDKDRKDSLIGLSANAFVLTLTGSAMVQCDENLQVRSTYIFLCDLDLLITNKVRRAVGALGNVLALVLELFDVLGIAMLKLRHTVSSLRCGVHVVLRRQAALLMNG